MEQQTNKEQEIQIDLLKILKLAKRFWLPIVLIAAIIASAVAVAYSQIYVPVYSSTSEYYLSNAPEKNTYYSASQTTGAEEMVSNYLKFLSGNVFLNYVREDLKETDPDITNEQLLKMISCKASSGSAHFTVTVTGVDADLNLRIAKSIEIILPIFCDEMNNQLEGTTVAEEIALTKENSKIFKTTKINGYAEKDTVADNASNRIKYPLIAFAVVFIAELAFVALYSILDVNIYTESDLNDHFPDQPVFGVIPEVSGKKKYRKKLVGLLKKRIPEREILPLLSEDSSFLVTEAFHRLRSNVIFCSNGEKGCSIAVTSSSASFGKTFLMSNLAISLSNMIDKKILLVDADLRCPAVHQFMKLENKNGLSNILAGQISFKDAIHTVSPSLDVITAGSIPPNPIELLSCKKMNEVMDCWKSEYDYILIDLPPVGEVADAFALVPFVSGFLFVMRSCFANARYEQKTLRLMKEKNAKVYGYVLTDVEAADNKKDYYYYYGYGHYSSYYSHYAKKKEEPKK